MLKIRSVLLCFQPVSRLKISIAKIELVLIGEGKNVDLLADILGCKSGFSTYKVLGL